MARLRLQQGGRDSRQRQQADGLLTHSGVTVTGSGGVQLRIENGRRFHRPGRRRKARSGIHDRLFRARQRRCALAVTKAQRTF